MVKKCRNYSILLALVLFAVYFFATSNSYAEATNHWSKSYIQSAEARGVFKTLPSNFLELDDPITRKEFVGLVNRYWT